MVAPATPTGRIVVLGATGYTGELAARALVDAGVRPVLAGRDAARLARLAAELGEPAIGEPAIGEPALGEPARLGGAAEPLEVALADVTDPASLAALLGRGDVLVTTVGPLSRWG